jgi:uncharacterized membrane protein
VFAAIWALATGRNGWFVVCGLGLLLVKEDGALVAVSCAWIAALEFGQRRPAAAVVCVAIVYGAIVNVWLIPHFRGSDLNPLAERFGYLGSSVPEILWSILTRPDLVMNQLADREIAAGVFLLMLGVAFLPLAVPKLLPSLVLVTLPALLSQSGAQPRLELHYLLVPATVALVLALMALRWLKQDEDHGSRMRMAGAGLVMAAVLVFAWQSPLPPSTAAEWDRFDIGNHARAADAIVAMVPDGAVVSAQSAFVPHLAERRKIYQFPRVVDAAWVITDKYGPVPADDLAAGYWTCVSALPRLGYDPVREDDGITVWEKRRTADAGADVTVDCSGGR